MNSDTNSPIKQDNRLVEESFSCWHHDMTSLTLPRPEWLLWIIDLTLLPAKNKCHIHFSVPKPSVLVIYSRNSVLIHDDYPCQYVSC